jgi:hypothetical protein
MYCILPQAPSLHEMDLSGDPAAAYPLRPYAGQQCIVAASRHGGIAARRHGGMAASRHGGASSYVHSTPAPRDALLLRH